MRPIGIVVCALAAAASILANYVQMTQFTMSAVWAASSAQRPEVWAAAAIDFVALIAWLAVVNDRWVRQAGDQYADALLAACDQLTVKSRAAPRKRKKC